MLKESQGSLLFPYTLRFEWSHGSWHWMLLVFVFEGKYGLLWLWHTNRVHTNTHCLCPGVIQRPGEALNIDEKFMTVLRC